MVNLILVNSVRIQDREKQKSNPNHKKPMRYTDKQEIEEIKRQLKPGCKVQIEGNTNKNMIGKVGTIVEVKRTRAIVEFGTIKADCHIGVLKPVSSDTKVTSQSEIKIKKQRKPRTKALSPSEEKLKKAFKNIPDNIMGMYATCYTQQGDDGFVKYFCSGMSVADIELLIFQISRNDMNALRDISTGGFNYHNSIYN